MAYPGPPRRAFGLLRYIIVAAGLVCVLLYIRHTNQLADYNSRRIAIGHAPGTPPEISDAQSTVPSPDQPHQTGAKEHAEDATTRPRPPTDEFQGNPIHPIDELIYKAEEEFAAVLKKESRDVDTAAAEYRKRRGRHPPPGFDVWFDFAQKNGAVMVEDFFDQIYHDLAPFWGLSPTILRRESWDYEMVINVRNQKANSGSDWFWTQIWLNMTRTIEDMLPDVDIPLNAMDEPRILAPWEEVNRLMEIERQTRKMADPKDVHTSYRMLEEKPEPNTKTRDKQWTREGRWSCLDMYISINTKQQDHSGTPLSEDATPTVQPAKQSKKQTSTIPPL